MLQTNTSKQRNKAQGGETERGCVRRISRSAYGDASNVGSPKAIIAAASAAADASHKPEL